VNGLTKYRKAQRTAREQNKGLQRTSGDSKDLQRTAHDFKSGCLFGKRYTDLSRHYSYEWNRDI